MWRDIACTYTIGWRTSKSGVPLRILGVAPIEDEKGVALKVAETGASHLTPLHAPVNCVDMTV